MGTQNKKAANSCEAIFDEFVLWYGGEFVEDLISTDKNKSSNADYLLANRTVVAELKCLQKEYFNDPNLGKKADVLLQNWLRQGKIPSSCIKGNNISIPENLAPKVAALFRPPIKGALDKANRQIRRTKAMHGAPNAKGLLILVNERNSALTPDTLFYLLTNLFKNRYTQIDSYIYAVPTMPMSTTSREIKGNIWVSGDVRANAPGVAPAVLSSIQKSWVAFLEQKFNYKIELIEPEDTNILKDMSFDRK